MTAPPGIERVLFTEEQVNQRIKEVAAEISAKYQGRDLKLIAVLKGAVFFLTALARAIEIPLKVDFLAISSFGNSGPGMVRIAKDLDHPIQGEDILLVEDIVDTGFTTRYLLQTLAGREPRSLGICTCSTGPRAGSCRCRWIIAASRSRTVSWWAAAWISSSAIATSGTSR